MSRTSKIVLSAAILTRLPPSLPKKNHVVYHVTYLPRHKSNMSVNLVEDPLISSYFFLFHRKMKKIVPRMLAILEEYIRINLNHVLRTKPQWKEGQNFLLLLLIELEMLLGKNLPVVLLGLPSYWY